MVRTRPVQERAARAAAAVAQQREELVRLKGMGEVLLQSASLKPKLFNRHA
jgi:hypothetical protein